MEIERKARLKPRPLEKASLLLFIRQDLEAVSDFGIPVRPIKPKRTELTVFVADRISTVRIFIGKGIKNISPTERER